MDKTGRAGNFIFGRAQDMGENQLTNRIILFIILATGLLLRIYDLFQIPYTHDEFSALFRTRFDNFSELIQKGVIVDTLPAGIQVFLYYWTRLFGFTEWVVKLPFIVMGTLSIWLIYRIAMQWYNETVGLIAAAFLASLQYTVIYSQIARPYSSGLFLSLFMVLYWTRIVRTPEKRFYLNSVLFVLFASLCAYNHHFSLLFAAIVGISGLFLIQKKYLLKYLISCLLVIVLYLPHVKILFAQMGMGGNEGWLGTLHDTFIMNYFEYVFQYSVAGYILVVVLIVVGLLRKNRQAIPTTYYILFLVWFFLPLIVGFLYSRFVNNVMQYSVLIFNFPFLLLVLFGHFRPLKPSANLLIVLAILIVNIYSLVFTRQHYSVFYNSQYVHVLTDRSEAERLYGNIPSLIDSDRKISSYYIDKYNLDTNFTWFDDTSPEKGLTGYLKNASEISDHFYFGCLSSNWPQSVPLILEYFHTIEAQHNYAGGTTYIFSKSPSRAISNTDVIEYQDFDSGSSRYWSPLDSTKIIDTLAYSEPRSYLVDENTAYSPNYSRALDDIDHDKNDFIDISLKVYPLRQIKDIILVAQLEKNNIVFYWGGMPFSTFISSDNTCRWETVYSTIKLSDIYIPCGDVQLKIFIWNKENSNFMIDDLTIKLRKGNPILYGWFNKI